LFSVFFFLSLSLFFFFHDMIIVVVGCCSGLGEGDGLSVWWLVNWCGWVRERSVVIVSFLPSSQFQFCHFLFFFSLPFFFFSSEFIIKRFSTKPFLCLLFTHTHTHIYSLIFNPFLPLYLLLPSTSLSSLLLCYFSSFYILIA